MEESTPMKVVLRDADIREVLVHMLAREHDGAGALIIDEFDIAGGRTRADVAVIEPSGMHGYEIKSDTDTFARLPKQIDLYSSTFDTAHIVVTGKHVDRALGVLPEWWGVLVAGVDNDGNVVIDRKREAARNPNDTKTGKIRLAWKGELVKMLVGIGIKGPTLRKRKAILQNIVCKELDNDSVRKEVIRAMMARKEWRGVDIAGGGDGKTARRISRGG